MTTRTPLNPIQSSVQFLDIHIPLALEYIAFKRRFLTACDKKRKNEQFARLSIVIAHTTNKNIDLTFFYQHRRIIKRAIRVVLYIRYQMAIFYLCERPTFPSNFF